MSRKKKISKAAEVRAKLRICNLNTDQLVTNNNDDDNAHSKLKKSYTGNSRATKFKKYGPSEIFTKAAKSSQPITNFFHKSQKAFGELKNRRNDEIEDKRNDNELEDEKNNDKIEYGKDDYELENKNDNDELEDDDDELEDDYNNELEDKDEDDKIKDKDDDDELEDKDDDDELEDKDDDELEDKNDDDELEDKDDDDTGNESEFENDNFNSKLIKLEEILSGQASLHSAKECHQKIKSIIDDEDVIEQSIEKSKKSISIKTSCVWLKKLGKEFLNKMLIYEMFMPTFEGENMEQKDPILLSNEKLHIFITHDKCLFYANDNRPIVWAPIGELPLRKKGQEKSIMKISKTWKK
ncbi:hypothetical protein C1645_839938 [Glomus cerebriforme]|uniref:Uncharacterized protein n=1 Tax=Glomus cerebriforme TaxID=658196 RepID=A0A397S2R8_9GLOM|nr:hypothetical protein C1645_839938 [Glomus cerebriforme]